VSAAGAEESEAGASSFLPQAVKDKAIRAAISKERVIYVSPNIQKNSLR
jgi:hypothetical protein